MTRDEAIKKVEAVDVGFGSARRSEITRLEGKLDLVLQAVNSSRDEARDNRRAIIANGWVIFGAIIVVVGVLVTVAPVIFDMGFKWRETITKGVQVL